MSGGRVVIPATHHPELHLMPAILIAHHDPVGLRDQLIRRRLHRAGRRLGPLDDGGLLLELLVQDRPGGLGDRARGLRTDRDTGQGGQLLGRVRKGSRAPSVTSQSRRLALIRCWACDAERLIGGTPARPAGRALRPWALPATGPQVVCIAAAASRQPAERPARRTARADRAACADRDSVG